MSEVSYSTRQTVSPVSTNRVATQTPPPVLEYQCCCSQVHVGSLSRESAGSPILVAENVTSATTHVTKVEERAELRMPGSLPESHRLKETCVCVADGEGRLLRDADREEDHNHGGRRRGPGAGTGARHLHAHRFILTVDLRSPSGAGYCNTGSEAAAS